MIYHVSMCLWCNEREVVGMYTREDGSGFCSGLCEEEALTEMALAELEFGDEDWCDDPERVPAEVFSPGEYLNDELVARGWNQMKFADIIGRTPTVVNQIVTGKRSITPGLAKEIAAAFGTSPMVWLNLEAAY